MPPVKIKSRFPFVASLIDTFGFSPALATLASLGIGLVCVLAVAWVVRSAPPRTLVISAGPEGSTFRRFADAYRERLAKHEITLEVLESQGSAENLARLQSHEPRVDIAFVQGGLAKKAKIDHLVSLGSVAYQPLWVFYRNPTPITRLSELAGKRVAIGAVGSGTHDLALALLAANGITGDPTILVDLDARAAAAGLTAGRLDAIFLMGDSGPIQTLRTLVQTPEVQAFNFTQADAYLRRFDFLSRITLPEGAMDLGKNLPARSITLVGPTVELLARDDLNSALSDLLLDVAKEVHGQANILQKRGEFPAPLEREYKISEDARVYYKSGMGYFYRLFDSFWVASMLNRILVAIIPLALVLIPAIRFLPVLYRWSVQLKIYRCYRPLLRIERDAVAPLTPERGQELLEQLGEVEEEVNKLRMPASFAFQFYELRGHLAFVRARLHAATPAVGKQL